MYKCRILQPIVKKEFKSKGLKGLNYTQILETFSHCSAR